MKISFENTRRLIEQGMKINDIIRESISMGMQDTEEKAIHAVNKAVYEMAEKEGISIWDVCFHFVPQYDYSGFEIDRSNPEKQQYVMKGCVNLVPIEFELEKGPGYWKGKYFNLKRKMQDLINSKDDETDNR